MRKWRAGDGPVESDGAARGGLPLPRRAGAAGAVQANVVKFRIVDQAPVPQLFTERTRQ